MKTFPAATAPDGRLVAFEVENAYIGPSTVARLLRQADGVAHVEQRRLFSRDSDVHVRFTYLGQPCIVWEPYGDNSRYWIGPENPDSFNGSMGAVEEVLASHKPPMHRALIGDLLSLRFGKRYLRILAAVMQDDVLLAGSLKDNVCFNAERPDQARIEQCAELAQVHSRV